MKKFWAILALLFGLCTAATASTIENQFSAFYSLGDSLADDGKLGPGVLDPPSFNGRFTNDLVWSEYIEGAFASVGKDSANYALGGATASVVNLLNPTPPLNTLENQIGALLLELSVPLRSPGANPLVSLWFGANDIFQGRSPIDAANAVDAGIRYLATLTSGLFDDYLIFKLPDLGQTPSAVDPATAAALTAASSAFNAQLAFNTSLLTREGFNVTLFDPQLSLAKIAAAPGDFGIVDTTTPCTVQMSASLLGLPSTPACSDPSLLLFADSVHPNGTAHALLADEVQASFATPVPLPSGLPLVLAAMGAFAALRLRRDTSRS